MTLKEAMPYEFSNGEYDNIPAQKFKDLKVIFENDKNLPYAFWEGTHKNVHYWVILENGYAAGWNENPSVGWSFPIYNYCNWPKTKGN